MYSRGKRGPRLKQPSKKRNSYTPIQFFFFQYSNGTFFFGTQNFV